MESDSGGEYVKRLRQTDGRPGGLPVVRINGVSYVMDGRLKQLRAVSNPEDWVDFEPDEIEPWAVD